uniref:Uncharacterized protein n=1 Tax=Magallana gigas TaxID=29159 RepID=K1RBW5_MAGGI
MTSRKPMLKRIKGRAPAAGSSVDDPRALYMTQVGQPSADPILILEIRTQEPATNTQRPHSQGYEGMVLSQLLPKLRHLRTLQNEPNIIILHCGANSLGLVKLESILEQL